MKDLTLMSCNELFVPRKVYIFNYDPANGSTSMMKYVMNDHATDKERYKDVVAATDTDGKNINERKANM